MLHAKLDPRIPAELAKPTLRPTRARRGTRGGVWFLRLFTLPFIAVGVGMVGAGVADVLLYSFGKSVPATITSTKSVRGSKGGYTYHVYYTTETPGSVYSDSQQVTIAEYRQVAAGQPATAITLRIGPWRLSRLTQFNYWSNRGAVILIFGVFWNGITWLFAYFAWFVPLIHKHLVRDGQPIMGSITRKTIIRAKSTTYKIYYEFQPPGEAPIQRSMQVNKNDYDNVETAEAVTILFNPLRPKRSVVYKCADYEVAT